MFELILIGIMASLIAAGIVILMVRDEPPAFEPYEQETVDDFKDEDFMG